MPGVTTRRSADVWLRDRRAFAPTWRFEVADWVRVALPSPDGELVAVGSASGESLVARAADGAPASVLPGHDLGVASAAWSADGATLAVGGEDGRVHLWDRAAGTVVVLPRARGWITDLRWSTSGLLAIAAGKAVVVVDRAGREVARYPDATSTVTSLAWSSDGRRLAAASYGGVWWYEPSTNPATAHNHFAWKGSVLAVAIGPGDKWMVGGGQDDTIHVWRLWSGNDYEMSGFPSKVDRLTWHHSGRWMMAGCTGIVTRWDFSGKGPAGRNAEVFETNDTRVDALQYQPGGDVVAGALAEGDRGAVVLWRPQRSRQPWWGIPLPTRCGVLSWFPDGSALVVGLADGTVARIPVG